MHDIDPDAILYAASCEQAANRDGYQPPAEVKEAQDALANLWNRRKADGWRDFTRDERRLKARYESVVLNHERGLLAKWGPRPVHEPMSVDTAVASLKELSS